MKETQKEIADVVAETNPLWQFLEKFSTKRELEEHTIKRWGVTWIELQDCLRGERSLTARQLIDIALDLDLTAQDVAAMFYKSSVFGVPRGTKIKIFTEPGPFTLVAYTKSPSRRAVIRSYLEAGQFRMPIRRGTGGVCLPGFRLAISDAAFEVPKLKLDIGPGIARGTWTQIPGAFSTPDLDWIKQFEVGQSYQWLPVEFSLPVQPQFAIKEK